MKWSKYAAIDADYKQWKLNANIPIIERRFYLNVRKENIAFILHKINFGFQIIFSLNIIHLTFIFEDF